METQTKVSESFSLSKIIRDSWDKTWFVSENNYASIKSRNEQSANWITLKMSDLIGNMDGNKEGHDTMQKFNFLKCER